MRPYGLDERFTVLDNLSVLVSFFISKEVLENFLH